LATTADPVETASAQNPEESDDELAASTQAQVAA
jgi:hypothetical protein